MSFFDRQAITMVALQGSCIYSEKRTQTPSKWTRAFSRTVQATRAVLRTKHATEAAARLERRDLTILTDYSFVSPSNDK